MSQSGSDTLDRRRLLVGGAAAIAGICSPVCVRGDTRPVAGGAGIEPLLEPIRKKHDLPALAAAAVVRGKTAAVGAVGVRKYGTEVAATAGDQFHIGSCTKAMTATLAAILVEEGKLAWDLTLAKAFPELRGAMHADRAAVTLEMLLCHRGGFPERSAPAGWSLRDVHRLHGTPREQREAYASAFLKEKPEVKGGQKYTYSNAGFVIAGVIAERAADEEWESLITRRLFGPLQMSTAGFGAMGTPGKVDQPLQHLLTGAQHLPVEPGPRSDNPIAIGPAGRVHCSAGDWAKFAAAHAGGERNGSRLLKAATFRKLHTPLFGGEYAFGWLIAERGWGGGRVLTHAGSNTLSYAVVWLAPLRDFAALAVTNQAGDAAAKATDEACAALIGRYLT